MFAQFLDIVFKSLKLDKTLYRTPRYYGEAGIYFAILIMILDGVAGAVAANTIVKTSVGSKIVPRYRRPQPTPKWTTCITFCTIPNGTVWN